MNMCEDHVIQLYDVFCEINEATQISLYFLLLMVKTGLQHFVTKECPQEHFIFYLLPHYNTMDTLWLET